MKKCKKFKKAKKVKKEEDFIKCELNEESNYCYTHKCGSLEMCGKPDCPHCTKSYEAGLTGEIIDKVFKKLSGRKDLSKEELRKELTKELEKVGFIATEINILEGDKAGKPSVMIRTEKKKSEKMD